MTSNTSQVETKQDRAALIAALGFPVLVIIGAIIGFTIPETVTSWGGLIGPLLGIIMFGMGLTLKPHDFALVLSRPIPVFIGVLAQFIIMPAVAFALVKIFRLPAEIAIGVILVGCSPGGTSSNVVSYLCRGDVALSVTMTAVSTLLAPIMTPLLTKWLVGEYMPLEAGPMALSIVKMVLVPVIAGIVIRVLFPKIVDQISTVLPWICVLAISLIVAIVVGQNKENILVAGALVFLVVIIHNVAGMALGYLAAKLTHQRPAVARTMAIEVGMQNSGLAASLASTYFSPMAALPAAIFSIWHNLSGALVAALFRFTDHKKAKAEA